MFKNVLFFKIIMAGCNIPKYFLCGCVESCLYNFYGLFTNKPMYVGMLKPVDIKHYLYRHVFEHIDNNNCNSTTNYNNNYFF